MKSKGWYSDRDQKRIGRKERKTEKRVNDKKDKIEGGSVEDRDGVYKRKDEEGQGKRGSKGKKKEKGIVGKNFNERTEERRALEDKKKGRERRVSVH